MPDLVAVRIGYQKEWMVKLHRSDRTWAGTGATCGCKARKPQTQIWRFPKMEYPQNGWFVMENPI